jgi:signal transduction histidine kinase
VGLRSMKERAESLGGTLRVDSEPEKGTRVEMRVPLDGLHP